MVGGRGSDPSRIVLLLKKLRDRDCEVLDGEAAVSSLDDAAISCVPRTRIADCSE